MKKEQEMEFILMIYGSYKQILTGFISLISFPPCFQQWTSIKLITCINSKHAHLKGSYESTKYIFNAIMDVIK